ncbi:calcium-binding protein [Pseudomonas subflava]|uniref:calcium-binding protein n=1 Tax=Pseudomonas subflava TaxID=2952933 RepID=UPI00207934BD|nr:calcium-binding protein [Pseudomonas subflava]
MDTPSRLLVQGTSGDDLLVAPAQPTRLVGGAGNDILIDSPGSDAFYPGAGANRLYGGLGNDYYMNQYSGGSQEILDFDPTPGNVDTFDFGESPENVAGVERHGDDLHIRGGGGDQDVVIIRSFFLDPAFRIERFRFYGEVLTDKDILRVFHVDPAPVPHADEPPSYTEDRIRLSGGEKSDHLAAGDQATYLSARWGHDLLIGSRYSDVLNAGNSESPSLAISPHRSDRLFGGPGGDYYRVDSDWRHAEISLTEIHDYDTTPGNIDTLHIRGDESPAYMRITGWERGSLVLELNTNQRITLHNYFLDKAFVIEKIRFDDGTVLDEAAIRQRVGLPPATPPQVSLSTPGDCCAGAAPAVEADGFLGLVLAAGALLGRAGG